MSARNMVKSLRDSGALETRPRTPAWRTGAIFVVAALACFAVVYLGAVFVFPNMGTMFAKKPVQVAYAKPDSGPQIAAISADAKPYARADEVICKRFGAAARKRADQAKAKQGFSFDLGGTRYVELAGNLVCEAQTRPMRLCDPAERARFIGRSQKYFEEVQMMVSMFGASMSSPGFALVPQEHPGKAMIGEMTGGLVGTIEAEHRKVAQTFRDLAVRGLISAGDFGGGILGPPEAVRMIFADMPAVENVCAKV
jgi:hypothetical protein